MKKIYNKKLWESMRVYQEIIWTDEVADKLIASGDYEEVKENTKSEVRV